MAGVLFTGKHSGSGGAADLHGVAADSRILLPQGPPGATGCDRSHAAIPTPDDGPDMA